MTIIPTTATNPANKLPFNIRSPSGLTALLFVPVPLPLPVVPCEKPVDEPTPTSLLLPDELSELEPLGGVSPRVPSVPGPAPLRPGTVARSVAEGLPPEEDG